MSAQKAIVHEIDFLSHLGLQKLNGARIPEVSQDYCSEICYKISVIQHFYYQYLLVCEYIYIAQLCENKARKNNWQEIRDALKLNILRYVGYHCNSLAVNYKCTIRILTVFQKNTKKIHRTDPNDTARFYSASRIIQNRIALDRSPSERLKNRQRSFASVA